MSSEFFVLNRESYGGLCKSQNWENFSSKVVIARSVCSVAIQSFCGSWIATPSTRARDDERGKAFAEVSVDCSVFLVTLSLMFEKKNYSTFI